MSLTVDEPVVVEAETQLSPAPGRFPPRPTPVNWPATCVSPGEVLRRLTAAPFVLEDRAKQARRVRGLGLVVGWLEDQPGRTWQERWLTSGADAAVAAWRKVPEKWLQAHGDHSKYRHEALVEALSVAISADIVRPSLTWLAGGGPANGGLLVRALSASRDAEGFARLAAL